jgi:hypothetical protein
MDTIPKLTAPFQMARGMKSFSSNSGGGFVPLSPLASPIGRGDVNAEVPSSLSKA